MFGFLGGSGGEADEREEGDEEEEEEPLYTAVRSHDFDSNGILKYLIQTMKEDPQATEVCVPVKEKSKKSSQLKTL